MEVPDEDDILLNCPKHNVPDHVLEFDLWEAQVLHALEFIMHLTLILYFET